MKQPNQMSRTAVMVEGALMIALAYVLSYLRFKLPFGGSITLFSTLPILMMSFRHGGKWGIGTALVYSFLQALQGADSIALCKTWYAMLLCALLDYILAYASLGIAGPVARKFKNGFVGVVCGTLATGALRLLWSFLSGIVLWREYAPAGEPVWLYSIKYNSSWLLPDLALALFAVVLLSQVKPLAMLPQPEKAAAQ